MVPPTSPAPFIQVRVRHGLVVALALTLYFLLTFLFLLTLLCSPGEPSAVQREMFTRVLKGHIGVDSRVFVQVGDWWHNSILYISH